MIAIKLTIKIKRFNYVFGLHFGVKISKWYPNFLKSQIDPFFVKRSQACPFC